MSDLFGLDRVSAHDKELELLTRQVASRELYGITIWGGVIGAVVGVSMSVILYFLG